jgi:hypothetical protein
MYFLAVNHCGIDGTSTQAKMASLQCSPIGSDQNESYHLQLHLEYLHGCDYTTLYVGKHLSALLHLNLLSMYLVDYQRASQQ